MSIQAVAWVLEESTATYADRLVFIAIANHIGATGWAWPSVPHIAHEARVDRATVYRAIDTLEESGELTVQRRPGKSNLYGLPPMLKGSQIATGQVPVEGSQIATGKGSQSATKGSQIATGGVAICDPNHKEPSKNRYAGAHARPTTHPPTPAELPAETRAKGAQFFKALRTGDKPT